MKTFDRYKVIAALVEQYRTLATEIDAANDPDELMRLSGVLLLLKPLWESLDYGLRVAELQDRLSQSGHRVMREAFADLPGPITSGAC